MTNQNDILVVDDEEMIFEVIKNIFKKEPISFGHAKSFEEAIDLIRKNKYKIIIVDYDLGFGNKGTEIIKYLKEASKNIPVVIISGTNNEKSFYLEEGAISFITKPFFGPELFYTVKNLLNLVEAYESLEEGGAIIKALSSALDSRDSYTEGHSIRVLQFSVMLYESLGYNDEEEINTIKVGALLHDIGKIGVLDSILISDKRLTEEQYEEVKKHPVMGYEICKSIKNLKPLLPIIRNHHEKINGTGYPDGLIGDEIPHMVHVVTIADIFDALTTERTYREAFHFRKAIEILYKEAEMGELSEYFVSVFEKLVLNKTRKRVFV